jgi:hypothetical protein
MESTLARTIFIGDIHGCWDELRSLLDKVALTDDDVVVSVGDLVDRGPDPASVIDFFRRRPGAVVVCGNHERKHVLLTGWRNRPLSCADGWTARRLRSMAGPMKDRTSGSSDVGTWRSRPGGGRGNPQQPPGSQDTVVTPAKS